MKRTSEQLRKERGGNTTLCGESSRIRELLKPTKIGRDPATKQLVINDLGFRIIATISIGLAVAGITMLGSGGHLIANCLRPDKSKYDGLAFTVDLMYNNGINDTVAMCDGGNSAYAIAEGARTIAADNTSVGCDPYHNGKWWLDKSQFTEHADRDWHDSMRQRCNDGGGGVVHEYALCGLGYEPKSMSDIYTNPTIQENNEFGHNNCTSISTRKMTYYCDKLALSTDIAPAARSCPHPSDLVLIFFGALLFVAGSILLVLACKQRAHTRMQFNQLAVEGGNPEGGGVLNADKDSEVTATSSPHENDEVATDLQGASISRSCPDLHRL